MRVTSALWVSGLVRRANAALASAMVVHHGDDQAGAILIKAARLDRTAALYAQVPAGLSEDVDSLDTERRFAAVLAAGTPEAEVDAYIQRQRDFDPDLWLVEIEDRDGRHFLDGWLAR
jgi:hypothetical protein